MDHHPGMNEGPSARDKASSKGDNDRGLQQVRDRIAQAEKMGINTFGDTFQNTLAADMLGGSISGFGRPYRAGSGNPEADRFLRDYATQYQDISGESYFNNPATFVNTLLSKYGSGSPRNTLMQNIYNQMVPGQATPLGILASVPSLMSNVPSPVSAGVGLANLLAGKLNIGTASEEAEEAEEEQGPGYAVNEQGDYVYDSPLAFARQIYGKFK